MTSPGDDEALHVARGLIAAGIPVFAAPPATAPGGEWDPTGGTGGCGYQLPPQWQKTVATTNWLDPTVQGFESKAWRPGWALCAVMGHGIDALDVDPRHGGDASREALIAEGVWPEVYAVAETPSDGAHYFVAGLGVGSRDALRPGLDLKGGKPDGTSRGFVFIAPTVKRSKTTGELRPYRWGGRSSLAGLAEDDSGHALAALVRPAAKPAPVAAVATSSPGASLEPLEGERLAGYVAAARSGEIARLRAMGLAATPDGHGYTGDPWDSTVFQVACSLAELANADWSAYSPAEAHADLFDNAPRDVGFGDAEVAKCWASAVTKVAGVGRARPQVRADQRALVADWTAEAGVRLDPALNNAVSPQAAPIAQASVADQLTDAHLTDRVARDVLAGAFCWSAGFGWLRWDGRRWAGADEAEVTEAVRLYIIGWLEREARAGCDSTRLKALTALCSRGRITALVGLARGVVHVDPADFDAHPDLLNVGNGVVDLRTGDLLPHDPALRLTKLSTVTYLPSASHPDWDTSLSAISAEVAAWLQVRAGQAASGHMTPDDLLPVLQGTGANGKSNLLGGLSRALGEHAVTVPERVLLANPSDHPTELMTLRGARLAIIEELPEGGRLSVKRLKDTCGTPTMTARHIRRDNVTWQATHSLMLATNYVPAVNEVDHGTWRRLALVRFPFTYCNPGDNSRGPWARPGDPALRDRMLAGLQGQHEAVLAWLVAGSQAWYAHGRQLPPLPDNVRQDTAGWRAEADRIHGYFADRLRHDPAAHVVATDLFADFSEWLTQHGYQGWSDQTFASRFSGHELIDGHGVAKIRIASGTPSRRPGTLPQPPASRYTAWRGLAFASPEHAQSQGWQGSSHDALENAS